jgi:DNA-binding CsgD family transcriptional regulator
VDGDQRQRALDKLERLSSQAADLATLWEGTTEVLADAVPFYWTPCFYTLDPASLLVTSHVHYGLEEFPREWLEQEYDGKDVHSLIDVALSPTGVSTLHEVTGGDPRSTRRWQENIALGGDQELIARLRTGAGETWGTIGLYREPDRPLFDEADREFFVSLSPVLAAGVRRALLLGEATDPEWPDSPGLLILDEGLAVESSSPGAERWLDELSAGPDALPASVLAVAAAALHRESPLGGEVPMARVLSRTGAWIVLHGAPLISDGVRRVAVIIEPANPDRILPLLMSAYGLTEREKQVVGLVLQGLATRQIASRLFVSTNTVQQHLTKIFEKVGVRSRGDLVARLFFTHYEPRFRDNELRVAAGRPMRGGPAALP